MKPSLLIALSLLVPTVAFTAQPKGQPAAFKPHPVTATFYIDNVQCGGCVSAIEASLSKVPSFKEFKMNPPENYAQISFDTHVSSFHQIAQAIANAEPQHGQKYAPTLRFTVPDYAKDDNAAKVDAVFAKRKEWVKVECLNREKGEFVIHFLPLQVAAGKPGPQGWNAGHFGHAIHDPAPKGLGLRFAMKREGVAPAPAKGKAKKKSE